MTKLQIVTLQGQGILWSELAQDNYTNLNEARNNLYGEGAENLEALNIGEVSLDEAHGYCDDDLLAAYEVVRNIDKLSNGEQAAMQSLLMHFYTQGFKQGAQSSLMLRTSGAY